jgi:hypothetical protein
MAWVFWVLPAKAEVSGDVEVDQATFCKPVWLWLTCPFPVTVRLGGGQVSDMKGYRPAMDKRGPAPARPARRQGIRRRLHPADLDAKGVAAPIPAKRNRKAQPVIDGHIISPRILVERCFSRFKSSRRQEKRQ